MFIQNKKAQAISVGYEPDDFRKKRSAGCRMINKSWFNYQCFLLKSCQPPIHAHLKLKVLYCTCRASRREKGKETER